MGMTRTPEQQERRRQYAKKYLHDRPEKREQYNQKRRDAVANRTPEQRERVRQSAKKHLDDRPEKREEYNKRRNARRAAMRLADPEKVKQERRERYAKNRETELRGIAAYYINNKEAILQRCKRYREKDPEEYRMLRREYYAENRDVISKRRKETQRDNLSDPYVAQSLRYNSTVLKVGDIPKELIEAKRVQIKLLRQIRKMI